MLPSLKACVRCRTHGIIKSLENALATDPAIDTLIQKFVLAYSSGPGEPGGLARALRNSPRLYNKFKKEQTAWVDSLDDMLTKMSTFSFAPQRFNTVCELSSLVIRNLNPIFRMLTQLRAGNDEVGKWAEGLMQCFDSRSLLLLSLTAELSSVATRYARRFDNAKGATREKSHIARNASWLLVLEDECRRLFSFRDERNNLQEPLVLSAQFESGYCQILQRTWNLLSSEAVISSGRLLFYKSGAKNQAEVRSWAAECLGSISNVTKLFLDGVRGEFSNVPAAASLQPFDLDHWRLKSDDALQGPRSVSKRSANATRAAQPKEPATCAHAGRMS